MTKTGIDAIDLRILHDLIGNARTPFLEIARACGISGAAIHQRVRKLEQMGVILGSTLKIDPRSVGFDVCAYIGIQVTDPSLNQHTLEALEKIPEIVECHFIAGKFNILAKLYCVDNDHLMRTIFDHVLQVQGVSTTETFISLNEAFSRQVSIEEIKSN